MHDVLGPVQHALICELPAVREHEVTQPVDVTNVQERAVCFCKHSAVLCPGDPQLKLAAIPCRAVAAKKRDCLIAAHDHGGLISAKCYAGYTESLQEVVSPARIAGVIQPARQGQSVPIAVNGTSRRQVDRALIIQLA
jgi:hypothetical protein